MIQQILSDKIKALIEYFELQYSLSRLDIFVSSLILSKQLYRFVLIGLRPRLFVQ